MTSRVRFEGRECFAECGKSYLLWGGAFLLDYPVWASKSWLCAFRSWSITAGTFRSKDKCIDEGCSFLFLLASRPYIGSDRYLSIFLSSPSQPQNAWYVEYSIVWLLLNFSPSIRISTFVASMIRRLQVIYISTARFRLLSQASTPTSISKHSSVFSSATTDSSNRFRES